MDEKDREIIRLLQQGFPLVPDPYRVIGDKLWIDEVTVISRLVRMNQMGVVRHLGVFFDTQKLGYKGVLAAVDVEEKDVERTAEVINSYPQVTHNYLRDGKPNIWFTVIAKNDQEMEHIFSEIKSKTGIEKIEVFPAVRHFKVRTDLA